MSTENQDEIRPPADVYGRLFTEVGIENRGIIQETIERHFNDYPMTHGTVEEGIQHIVTLVKDKLPKPKPEPQPMEDGYRYQEGPKAEKYGLTDAITRRKAQRRGR